MSTLFQDIRFGLRTLLKRPGFSAVAVLTLALGIGANTAIFSVVNAVLLQPLPYADPDRLVLLRHRITATDFPDAPLPPADVLDFREQCKAFAGVAATDRTFESNLTGGDSDPIEVKVAGVTDNFFDVLGVKPFLGRTLTSEDGRPLTDEEIEKLRAAIEAGELLPGNNVVISHGLWLRWFGADLDVLGRPLILNDFQHTVVGVMPRDFELLMPANAGMPAAVDVWNPDRFNYRDVPRSSAAANRRVIARLKQGVDIRQAQAEVDKVAAWQRDNYDYHRDGQIYVDVKPMHADIVGHVRPVLLSLLGAVAFVLLIACANIANLLLVQAARREREMAIRAALGGSRRRIVRQLLTESLLLAGLGGLTGLLLARWGIDLMLALRPENLPRVDHVGFDGAVLLFTLGATLFSALLFGLAPALQASKLNLQESLKDRGTISPDFKRRRLRGALVVTEVALSMVLLIGGGLMFRSFLSLQRVDLGFDPARAVTFRVSVPPTAEGFRQPVERALFFASLEDRIGGLPGVTAVGSIQVLPLSGRFWTSPYTTEWSEADAWTVLEADYRFVTPGWFEAIGARLVDGRILDRKDNLDSLAVVVVDRAMAARAWPGRTPIGQRLQVELMNGTRDWVKVVGVIENIRSDNPAVSSRETIYFPHLLQAGWGIMTVVVRAEKDPKALVPAIRKQVAKMDADLPVAGVRTMEAYVSEAMAPTRFAMILIVVFAGVALALASVGLYGVISSLVRQRTHEFGVHMAFGAERPQILRMVLWRGFGLSVTGVLIGLGASLALTRLLTGLLTGVTATDPATFALVATLLTVVTLIASVVPARRAVRVDPMEALRYE